MLRRLYHTSWDAWSAAEVATLSRLAAAPGRPDRDSLPTEASDVLNAFLEGLEAAAQELGAEAAPRAYRVSFTSNYHALFPDQQRHYRADLLDASVERHSAIWVNGEKFVLSDEVMDRAAALQRSWSDLGVFLDRWAAAAVPNRPRRPEVLAMLATLDRAWATFEHRYITDLIDIELRARQWIVEAISHENKLQHCGKHRVEAQRRLVSSIAYLNSVANVRGKGRSDLGVGILDSALAVLRSDKLAKAGKDGSCSRAAAFILASDVVASFEAVRTYLREVSSCLERVDPHLSNNVGLVARLEDWEESWEVGARYLLNAPLLDAVCDLVAEIRRVQQVEPAFTSMCEDCDAELFLVLPRVVMLCYVAEPGRAFAELLRNLLPHRFLERGRPSAELAALASLFARAATAVAEEGAGASKPQPPRAEKAAFRALLKRAVEGSASASAPLLSEESPCAARTSEACLFNWVDPRPTPTAPSARTVVEELMRELEKWSLELQRHCASDWNQCSAMLLHCVSEVAKKGRAVTFEV